MVSHKKIGAAIALVIALLAAVGRLTGYFHIQAAVGLAIVGIVIGTGVARGAFSSTDASKRS
jgi:uncharacterized membrane protein (UPF0136 family)